MSRIHSIDVLKLIIASGVVWAHVTLMTLQGGALAYLFGQGLVRTVVPTFAVISGFLFHSTFHHGRARGWLTRLLVFYLFWCAFYLPIWWPEHPTWAVVLQDLIFGPMHLWYMAALMVALGLIRAVLALAGSERQGRLWLIGTGLVCLLIGTAVQSVNFFASADLSIHVWRNGVFFEFPFAVIGYLVADRIYRKGWDWVPSARVAWLVLLVLAVLRLGEAAIGLHLYGASILAPPEFPLLALAFSLMVLLAALRTDVPKAPVNLAFLSMMIYFLHLIVLLVLMYFGVQNVAALTLLGIALPALAGMVLIEVGKRMTDRLPDGLRRRVLGRGGVRGGDESLGTSDAKADASAGERI
jgi:peptidoglycan/LPS O-acetylase OafA/YrhL